MTEWPGEVAGLTQPHRKSRTRHASLSRWLLQHCGHPAPASPSPLINKRLQESGFLHGFLMVNSAAASVKYLRTDVCNGARNSAPARTRTVNIPAAFPDSVSASSIPDSPALPRPHVEGLAADADRRGESLRRDASYMMRTFPSREGKLETPGTAEDAGLLNVRESPERDAPPQALRHNPNPSADDAERRRTASATDTPKRRLPDPPRASPPPTTFATFSMTFIIHFLPLREERLARSDWGRGLSQSPGLSGGPGNTQDRHNAFHVQAGRSENTFLSATSKKQNLTVDYPRHLQLQRTQRTLKTRNKTPYIHSYQNEKKKKNT